MAKQRLSKLQKTAYHEAGHMLASELWGNGHGWVTIRPYKPRVGSAGAVLIKPVNIQNRWDARRMLYIVIAGNVSADIALGRDDIRIHSADYNEAKQLASYITKSDDWKIIAACITKCMGTVGRSFLKPKYKRILKDRADKLLSKNLEKR